MPASKPLKENECKALVHVEKPDRKEYEEFTGNSGPSLEHWYFKAWF